MDFSDYLEADKTRWLVDCGQCGTEYYHLHVTPPEGCAQCGSYRIRFENVDW